MASVQLLKKVNDKTYAIIDKVVFKSSVIDLYNLDCSGGSFGQNCQENSIKPKVKNLIAWIESWNISEPKEKFLLIPYNQMKEKIMPKLKSWPIDGLIDID